MTAAQATSAKAISGHFCWPESAGKLIVAALIVITTSASAAGAQSNCPGFEPFPPVGCKGPPRCLCDAEGRCGWVFDCDEN